MINHPDIPAAIGCVRAHFQTAKHRGPSQYAIFELTDDDEDERERLRRFAHGTSDLPIGRSESVVSHWPHSMTSATRNLKSLHAEGKPKAAALTEVLERLKTIGAEKGEAVTPEIKKAVTERAGEIWGK